MKRKDVFYLVHTQFKDGDDTFVNLCSTYEAAVKLAQEYELGSGVSADEIPPVTPSEKENEIYAAGKYFVTPIILDDEEGSNLSWE